MPWDQKTTLERRTEFVRLAHQKAMAFSKLCERYGVSRKTGYKWLARFDESSECAGLLERSRRPAHSPNATCEEVVQLVLKTRDQFPAWGGLKIHAYLKNEGRNEVPAASTCQLILKRRNRIAPEESIKHTAFKSFVKEAPNQLWQADYKGDIPCGERRCFPLTVLDDHSRFNVALKAHSNHRLPTVQAAFIEAFKRFGLPDALITDNGKPWGDSHPNVVTAFDIWLLCLGIRSYHSRPLHPQTLGKEERFHRTFKAELLQHLALDSHTAYQQRFDRWRDHYNQVRPHQALDMKTPASVYAPSPKPYPKRLPEIVYDTDAKVYKVRSSGCIRFRGKDIVLSTALAGYRIGLRPNASEHEMDVLFSRFTLGALDLRTLQFTKTKGDWSKDKLFASP